MKITATWLDTRKMPRMRSQRRQDVNVNGREGLSVRIHPSGSISFRMRYQRDGKRRWMVLGEYGVGGLSLSDAFDLHHQAQRELEKGLDPIEERERRRADTLRERQERAGADTVARLVEQFVHRKLRAERWDAESGQWIRDSRANIKARKRPDAAAALLGYVDPSTASKPRRGRGKPAATLISELGNFKAREITRRQLIALLDSIVARGAPVTANRVHALLVQMFTWAAAKDLIPASPMAGVERPGGDERPRQRILTSEEIQAFWNKLEDPKLEMAAPTRLALKLLLVTAQRRGELTFARWSHFDLAAKLWTIPVELLKSSHSRRTDPEPHIVPLSALAIDLLEQLKSLTGDGKFLLPARADKKRKDDSYSERVLSRAVRENAKEFGIAHFTPHDLRRTAASFMTKLKIPRLHVEKVLNHSTGDIAEVYDRHDYLLEKQEALAKWAKHLTAIIEGRDQKVVPLDSQPRHA